MGHLFNELLRKINRNEKNLTSETLTGEGLIKRFSNIIKIFQLQEPHCDLKLLGYRFATLLNSTKLLLILSYWARFWKIDQFYDRMLKIHKNF